MWNDSDPPAAWIPVPSPDALPAEVAAEIGRVSARIGFVPNVARLLAWCLGTSWAGGGTSTT
jgi:hypothetical protein